MRERVGEDGAEPRYIPGHGEPEEGMCEFGGRSRWESHMGDLLRRKRRFRMNRVLAAVDCRDRM